MHRLEAIADWQNSLGLLPIKLFSADAEINDYILLNGGTGDFCLQTDSKEHSDDYYFSSSWSSNTKSYVAVGEHRAKLYTWRNKSVETIDNSVISNHYEKFYDYIVRKSASTQYDIVPFTINIYRKLRNLLNDKVNGARSLNLLFLLLASYEEGQGFGVVDADKWGITDSDFKNKEFDKYLSEFSQGLLGHLPNIDLILRHASGQLFQEAQKEALLFNKNLNIFTGTLSGAYKTRKLLYSSVHYTPAYIARTIVENALEKIDLSTAKELKIFDPSCGSAEFLMESLKQLKAKQYAGDITIIGWDTSTSAISTTQFLLTYEKKEWGDKLNFSAKLVVDSLSETWDNDYDLILMNPPFVSWEQMPKEGRDIVKSTLDNTFAGKPNQASAFFYKAVKCLKPSGVIGCVIPTSLFSLDSYRQLRDSVVADVSFALLGKLGNFVFEDALVDVSIVVGQRPASKTAPLLVWTKNEKGVVSSALRELRKMQYENIPLIDHKDYSIYTPNIFPIHNNSWRPIPYKEDRFFKNIERFVMEGLLVRIGNIFNVQQGVRTGNNKVFKINSKEYSALNPEEQKYFRPAIDNDSIKNGFLIKNTYIWYPYGVNGLIVHTESDLQEKAPWFYSHKLLPAKDILQSRPSLREHKEWWELSEPGNWQFKRKPTLCSTEFGKADSFAFDVEGEFIIERGYGWIPKKKLEIDDYYFYLTILSSPLFNTLLSIYSKQLLSGWDLGKQYTKSIPLPNILSSELANSAAYERLVMLGKSMSNEGFYNAELVNEVVIKYVYPYSN